jgi:hypothetical protein
MPLVVTSMAGVRPVTPGINPIDACLPTTMYAPQCNKAFGAMHHKL